MERPWVIYPKAIWNYKSDRKIFGYCPKTTENYNIYTKAITRLNTRTSNIRNNRLANGDEEVSGRWICFSYDPYKLTSSNDIGNRIATIIDKCIAVGI